MRIEFEGSVEEVLQDIRKLFLDLRQELKPKSESEGKPKSESEGKPKSGPKSEPKPKSEPEGKSEEDVKTLTSDHIASIANLQNKFHVSDGDIARHFEEVDDIKQIPDTKYVKVCKWIQSQREEVPAE